MERDKRCKKVDKGQSWSAEKEGVQEVDLVLRPVETAHWSKADLEQFARMPHGQKQEVLAQLLFEKGGWLLNDLYGHQYDGFIFGLIPRYCTWPFLRGGGESEHIVQAGESGRRTGMEVVAADPFNCYTSGSGHIVEAEIVVSTTTLVRAVIRYGWEKQQEQELRYPSASLDALLETPDGEHLSLYDVVADPGDSGDPLADILCTDALQAGLSKLSRDTRDIFLEVESGKNLRTVARERGQDYGTVEVRYWRAKKVVREEFTRRETLDLDRDAAIDDGHLRLLHRILEDLPP